MDGVHTLGELNKRGIIMNRIYKTIWSEVHHTYIAVSEITKRKGKNSVRTSSSRRILAFSCALALTLGGIAGNAAGSNTLVGDTSSAWGTNNTASGNNTTAFGRGNVAGTPADENGLYTVSIYDGTSWVRAKADANGNVAYTAPKDDTLKTYTVTGSDNLQHVVYLSDQGHTVTWNNNKIYSVTLNADGTTKLGAESSDTITARSVKGSGGEAATAFGRNNIASGVNSLAFGGTTFTDKKGNQYQTQNVASGVSSVAFGEGSQALALGSVAFGNGTQAGIKSDDGTAGQNSVAFGGSTKATGGRSLAFGERTNAEQTNSVAFGLETKSMSAGSTAFGNRTRAIAEYATAMGNSSVAAGVNSVAFGTDTMAGAEIDEHGAIALQNGQKIDSNGYVAYVNNGKTYSVTYQRLKNNKGERSGEIHDYVVLAGNDDGKQYIRDYHGDIHEVTIGQDDAITVNDEALTDSVLKKPGEGGYYSAGYKINGYQNSTAFGSKTKATNNQATAFGTETVASGENSTVFGENSVASGKNSVAFGDSSKAYGENSLAGLGGTTGSLDDANKNGKNSIALGSGSLASHADTIAIGTEAKSDNDETTAVGNHVQATEKYAVAVGRNMVARGQAATAIGTSTHTDYAEDDLFGAKANWATVVGVNNNATAERATAFGDTNEAAGGRSTALGSSNHAYSENSLAVGTYSTAGKANATNNEGMSAVAVGVYADASGKGSTALGSGYTGNHTKDANGNETTAWEYIPTEASGDYSLALGNQAKATAANTAAMGYKAQATIADGVAIGSESKTNVDKDQFGYDVTTKLASTNGDATWKATRAAVSVGDTSATDKITRQITGVAAGFNDTDAVNVAQLKQVMNEVNAKETHFYSVNNTDSTAGNYNNDGATGTNALAAEVSASAVGENSVVIGSGAADSSTLSAKVENNKTTYTDNRGNVMFTAETNDTTTTYTYKDGTRLTASTGDDGTVTLSYLGYNNVVHNIAQISSDGTALAFASNAVAVGNGARAIQNNAVAIGTGAQASGENGVALGQGAQAINQNSVAIGPGANASAKGAIVIGVSTAAQKEDSIAIGGVTDGVGAVSIGKGSWAGAERAMSLGGIAIEGGSVALGWGAYADRKSGKTGYDPLNANTKSPAWISTAPAVSIGRIGVDSALTRQIIGVAAGSEDTDAVNVAQLKNAVTTSKVHYYGVNSDSTASGSNYNNEGAVGKNSLAAGAYTRAEGKNSIAIGSGKMNEYGSLSYYTEKDGSKTYMNVRAAGEGAIAIGSDIKAWNEGNIAIGDTVITSGSNATAIGKKTVAGAHSVAIGDTARTGDNYSIVIGYNAGVSGFSEKTERNKTDTYGVAIGPQAYSNYYSVALGNANAAGWYATALGYKANASRDRSTALGPEANASGVESIAIGPSAISSGNKTVGIGSGARPTSDESITIGTGANSSGEGSGKDKDGKDVTYSGSISIGTKAESDSYYSVTLGTNSHTVSEKSIALGYSAHTTGKSSIAEGDSANSVGTYSTAIGAGAKTLSTGSIAIGHDAKANNDSAENSIALGTNAVSQGNGSIALGVGAAAYNGTNIAIGQKARVAGTYSHSTDNNVMAIGNDALASGAGNIAIGYGARSTSSSNESEHNILAIGNGAKAVGNGAVALGYNTDAWMEDSVVLGSNSQSVWSPDLSGYDVSTGTNSNDQSAVWKATNGAVSVGRTSGEITVKDSEGNETTQKVSAITRRIANVAAGVYDEDAVNVAQLRKMAEKVDSVSGQHTLVTVNGGISAPIDDTTKAYSGGYSTDGNLLIKANTSTSGQTTFDIKMNDNLEVGKAGKDGVDGKDGSIGINGKDGKPGTDGKQGITTTIIRTEKGQDGAQGEPGQQGAPGVDGSNITRIVYENGENGKDGNDGKHIVATLDDGLKFGANAPAAENGANPVANKLNTTVEVKGAGNKTLDNYSGKNLYTTVSQDGDGKTTIHILMDKDISGSSVTAGERGKNGTDGKDGKDGVDGSITIINGKPGTNGTDGLNGKDGKNASSEIHTHYGPVSLNDDKNVELEDNSKAMTRIHYVDQVGKDHEVATMDDGLYFTGNNTGTSNKHYLNSTVKVQGEGVTKDTVDSFNSAAGNVAVVADGIDTLTIKLNKDLNLGSTGSVTMGNTVINNGGMTITKTEGDKTITVSLTDGGLNNGGNKITNVANGTENNDAVNVSQLKAAKTEVKAGNHITVTSSTDQDDGHAIYTVSADLSALGGMSVFNVANNHNNPVAIRDGHTVDFVNGKNTTAVVTKKTDNTGVEVKYDLADDIVMGNDGKDGKPGKDGSIGLVGKDGKDGQDGQSYTTTIIKTIGKNGTDGTDGVPGVNGQDGITRIIYQDGKDGEDGVTKHVVATLDDGMKYAGDNGQGADNAANIIKKKLNEQLDIVGGADPKKLTDNNIGVNATTDGKLKVQLAQDLTGLNSIISNTYYAGDKTSNNYTTITGDGITIKNGDDNHKDISITSTNINMGGQQIHNVAAGTELTDAVNVSQLNEAKSLAGKHSEVTVEGGTSAGNTDYTGNNLKLKVSTAKDGHKVYDLETG